jgi:pyruvate formate lyase activating enzyme
VGLRWRAVPEPVTDHRRAIAERNVAAILDAAEALFAQRGFAATTIKQIGAEAGVNSALLYYYFDDKETLYREMLRRIMSGFAAIGTKLLADAASPEEIATAALSLGCSSVAFTYNDPVIFMEYAIDVADACRERGVKAVAVTAGYMCPEPRAEFYEHMDAANVDLKGFTEGFYADVCAGHLAPVLETLEYLKHETDVWFEITNLLIPGLNDLSEEIDAMTAWVVEKLGPEVPMHFTAFHPDYKLLDRPPTPASTLSRARSIALANGVRYAYTGNVHDSEGGSTYCGKCGEVVIERDWYRLGEYRLAEDGSCGACGCQVPGVFAGRPGTWGPRRLPVRMLPLAR